MAISAIADFQGTWVQGTSSSILIRITDFEGFPVDPEDIVVSIDTAGGTAVLTNEIPEKIEVGNYVYEWQIPENQVVGQYDVTWEFTTEDGPQTELQEIIVVADGEDSDIYSGRPGDLLRNLEYRISCAQNIPVYYEQCKPSQDNRTYYCTFPRWNQTPGIRVYRNKTSMMTTDDMAVDYSNGRIVFNETLTQYDEVYVDYNFRWFTGEELNQFLRDAVNELNLYPGVTDYTIDSFPDRWTKAVVLSAAVDALRKIMLCLNFQQPAQVFGGSEEASEKFSNFDTLKKNYEEEVTKMLEQKKYGPYPRTNAIVVPEYTLPGGRSRWFRYLFSSGI